MQFLHVIRTMGLKTFEPSWVFFMSSRNPWITLSGHCACQRLSASLTARRPVARVVAAAELRGLGWAIDRLRFLVSLSDEYVLSSTPGDLRAKPSHG